MNKLLTIVSLAFVLMKTDSACAQTALMAEGASLQKLADGFSFTEGPACDAAGNVFFTDQPNDKILKWSVDGQLSTFMHPCGRANGLCFDRHGNLWACADGRNELWKISTSGKAEVIITNYQGKLLNGPNDIWIRPDGGAYLTDPYYKRDYWKRGPKEIEKECVYFLPVHSHSLIQVADDLVRPNGIIGTSDGKLLYVADIDAHQTFRYRIQKDGSLTEKKLFCKMGSDGMTIDKRGNVYLTGKGVFIFDREGKDAGHIEVPEAWTGNVCFGGKDRTTLFITASKGFYGLKMKVAGQGSQ